MIASALRNRLSKTRHSFSRGLTRLFGAGKLEDSDFDHLLDPIDNLRYSAGALFYHQGDAGKTVFSIRCGLIKLTQTLADGSQRIVRLLGPGALVGLEALLGEQYRHTVIALQEVDDRWVRAKAIASNYRT